MQKNYQANQAKIKFSDEQWTGGYSHTGLL